MHSNISRHLKSHQRHVLNDTAKKVVKYYVDFLITDLFKTIDDNKSLTDINKALIIIGLDELNDDQYYNIIKKYEEYDKNLFQTLYNLKKKLSGNFKVEDTVEFAEKVLDKRFGLNDSPEILSALHQEIKINFHNIIAKDYTRFKVLYNDYIKKLIDSSLPNLSP